jgi:hypothetical protein
MVSTNKLVDGTAQNNIASPATDPAEAASRIGRMRGWFGRILPLSLGGCLGRYRSLRLSEESFPNDGIHQYDHSKNHVGTVVSTETIVSAHDSSGDRVDQSFSRSGTAFRAFARAVAHTESEEEFNRHWLQLIRIVGQCKLYKRSDHPPRARYGIRDKTSPTARPRNRFRKVCGIGCFRLPHI